MSMIILTILVIMIFAMISPRHGLLHLWFDVVTAWLHLDCKAIMQPHLIHSVGFQTEASTDMVLQCIGLYARPSYMLETGCCTIHVHGPPSWYGQSHRHVFTTTNKLNTRFVPTRLGRLNIIILMTIHNSTTCIYIYIYVYISFSLSLYIYIYNIHIHTHRHIYMYY